MRAPYLERLIDHAALFPPANMTMDDALAEDRAARASEYAWMLDRFVCPASKLGELPEDTPPLSVVADAPVTAPAAAFEMRLPSPTPDAAQLQDAAGTLRGLAPEVYFELVPGEHWRDTLPAAIDAVAAAGGRVKLRCGGEFVPPVELVALVLEACNRAGIAMKATAGLHHPLRRGGEHGFLNMLCAAALAHVRAAGTRRLEEVLAEESLAGLPLGELGTDEWANTRARLFKGFGSCSWREPVEDLRALGLLA